MREGSGRQFQGACQIALRIGARRHHLDLFPLGHPLIPNLGQQITIQFVGKAQGRSRPQLFDRQANARQLLHPLRIVILGG